MTELRQSKEYGEYLTRVGWQVEKQGSVQAFLRTIPFTPISVMKIQRASINKIDWDWIKTISRKHKVVVNYIELGEHERIKVGEMHEVGKAEKVGEVGDEINKMMKRQGYKPVRNGMLPTKTQVINVRSTKSEVRSSFKAKTRYNLGLAERKGLITEIKTGKDLLIDEVVCNVFLDIIRENANRVGYWAVPDKWVKAKFDVFKEQAFVVLVKSPISAGAESPPLYKGGFSIVSAALFLCTKTGCYYSLNGSTELGRKLFAPTLAVWAGIEEAKRRGLAEFDFDGVYDERYPNKRWLGYTRFKAGFGGEYIYYPPAFVKWLPGL